MKIQQCKFCGCTEQAGCPIPIRVLEDGSAYVETGVIEQLDIEIEYEPCHWIAEDVCSAPACVEKAYLEARPLAELVMLAAEEAA